MASMSSAVLLLATILVVGGGAGAGVDAVIVDGLQVGYYGRSCPEAEEVVRDVVRSEFNLDPTIAAGIIRIFFHDCFVTGCDASILLDQSPAGAVPEKESSANGFTLHGLRTIDIAKSTIEAMCPRTVSCADILAFAARDAAMASGLPGYDVAAGRRDGERSNMDDLPGNMPVPGHHVPRMTELFASRGMTQEDLVALSGAHSIGGAHCFMFSNRLYNFSDGADVDPTLDPQFAAELRKVCPQPKDDDDPETAPKVEFDSVSSQKLDNTYYAELLAGRGLLTSDNALVEDEQTKATVEQFAKDEALFHGKFAAAMQKLGALDVLIGQDKGQIRTQCQLVNSKQAPSQWQPRNPLAGKGSFLNWLFPQFQ